MRKYELMVIVAPTVEVTEKSAKEIVEKLVGSEAKVTEVSLLGKKKMAYPINKFSEGIYVTADLEGEHVHVNELEKKIQLGSDVIRYLLLAK
jgi:small subunit ribosomal protein S6